MTTVAELLAGHVTLEVECVDRLYLNGYIPTLATGAGMTGFLREHLGKAIQADEVPVASREGSPIRGHQAASRQFRGLSDGLKRGILAISRASKPWWELRGRSSTLPEP
jgi:hypothetical protein